MTSVGPASTEMARQYFALFVNRLAYTLQSHKPAPNGKHYYYRPKDGRRLSLETIREHLNGRVTIGAYALNPQTQSSKWVAIDADYENALEDLLKLQWELRQDGVEAALEKSRRGAHLWIFADKPLLARDCRVYIYNLALRLKVPVKGGAGLAEGIEIFPRQDQLESGTFGNAIRGPLGVHRVTGKRYWFYGADYDIEAQLTYLERLRKITDAELVRFIAGLEMPEEFRPKPKVELPPYDPTRREFHILDHVQATRRQSGNYWTRCPSCAEQGGDRSEDNLAISVADPRKYRCWAGCTKEMIRAALGHPIPIRRQVEHALSAKNGCS
jgi:TOTE conflict system, Archaeo-Eukaryotic Primase domain